FSRRQRLLNMPGVCLWRKQFSAGAVGLIGILADGTVKLLIRQRNLRLTFRHELIQRFNQLAYFTEVMLPRKFVQLVAVARLLSGTLVIPALEPPDIKPVGRR